MKSPFTDKTGNQLDWDVAINKIVTRFKHYGLDALLWWLHSIVAWIPSHLIRKFFYQLAGIKIGPSSTIHTGARFYQPNNIEIGQGSIIGFKATLDGRDKLTIGNHVDIASEVMIYNSEHDINDPNFKPISQTVKIEDYVFVGPRAIILPGVKLGRGSVVAAGAVVTKSVAPDTIVAGVPAKPIGKRQLKEYNYRLGRFRLFQ